MKTTIASMLPLLAAFSILLPCVQAHGFLTQFAVDGKSYKGNAPGAKPSDSPIRQISTIDPVKGANNANLKCGQNSKNAALVVDANPGSNISFTWGDPNGEGWPHNTGPLMTYMASCGDTTCDKFNATNAQWFKIAEAGKKTGDDSTWVQQDIMNGKSYSTQIPSSLASGQYLIRHEIIALHLATTEGGAEFYPSCTQVNVGGSQTGSPPKNDLVSFPGAYKDTDPGIFDQDVFNPGANYTFPGPPVAKLDSSSGSNGSNPTSPFSLNPSVSPSPSPTSQSGNHSCGSSSSKKRSLAKRQAITDDNSTKETRPRHKSRLFGKLYHNSDR